MTDAIPPGESAPAAAPAAPHPPFVEAAPSAAAPVRRRSNAGVWIVATTLSVGVLLALGMVATAVWFVSEQRDRLDASRITSPEQAEIVAAAFAAADVQIAATEAAAGEYRADRGAWDDDRAQVEQWKTGTDAPTPSVANPGGTAMPGGDPQGRAFLDSIGAGGVQLAFEAGEDNCGYALRESNAWDVAAGGCYNSGYPSWLFIAWDPGAESIVWPIFVHEAMHWYQYQNYYPDLLAADRAGVSHEQYGEQFEADASCRAVYTYGIPISEYADSSSPCTVDGWYEGWIRDYLGSLGVPVTEPVVADYEVSEVVRP